MRLRQIDYDIKYRGEQLLKQLIMIDDPRFSILLYTLVNNSVTHTPSGSIKISVKILDKDEMKRKTIKLAKSKRLLQQRDKAASIGNAQRESMSSVENVEVGGGTSSTSNSSGMAPKADRFGEDDWEQASHLKVSSDCKREEDISLLGRLIEPQKWLSLSVSDTGSGMTPEARKNCFTMFGNPKVKKSINQGGMGLGLSVSKMICKALHGKLTLVRTGVDQGTKFNFILPISLGQEIMSKSSHLHDDDDGDSVSNSELDSPSADRRRESGATSSSVDHPDEANSRCSISIEGDELNSETGDSYDSSEDDSNDSENSGSAADDSHSCTSQSEDCSSRGEGSSGSKSSDKNEANAGSQFTEE